MFSSLVNNTLINSLLYDMMVVLYTHYMHIMIDPVDFNVFNNVYICIN